jgi:predicted Zn-dependent protease with MMP-like domain
MAAAQEETDALVRALPAPLRKEARAIPLSFEPAPSALLQGDGIAADTLGLFTGEAFPDKYVTAHELPAQIILFLENLWDFAQHDPASYREEVRKTYLHELGHYLGLDEDALVDRDLD